jgi:hypothetical protein
MHRGVPKDRVEATLLSRTVGDGKLVRCIQQSDDAQAPSERQGPVPKLERHTSGHSPGVLSQSVLTFFHPEPP